MKEVYVVTRHPAKCFEYIPELIGVTEEVEQAQQMAKDDIIKFDGDKGINVVVLPNMVEVYIGKNAVKMDDEDEDDYYYYSIDEVQFVRTSR